MPNILWLISFPLKRHFNQLSKVSATFWNFQSYKALIVLMHKNGQSQKFCDWIFLMRLSRLQIQEFPFQPHSVYVASLSPGWSQLVFRCLIVRLSLKTKCGCRVMCKCVLTAHLQFANLIMFFCDSKRRPKTRTYCSCLSSSRTWKTHRCMY